MRGFILLAACLLSVRACPQAVASVCRCEDLHNGVSLNCSDSDGATVIETLKTNQALLGLIQNLVMHRANIRVVPASFFAGLYIKRLDLSYNRIVKLDPAAFAGMSPVMQELSLTHNNLTEIPSEALKEAKTLMKLDLSNNTIGDLSSENAIPFLPKLFDLNLAHNNICTIHKNALSGVRDYVQTINLGHNCISTVPAPAIRGFKQLMALHMHHNQIKALDALSFMNLPIMNLLNLASNNITEIKPQAFLNVPNLRYLYLTNNQVSAIAAHQFSGFEQLEMLDLTGNKIEAVPSYGFSGLSQLRQLYLGNNQISLLEPDAFANSSIVILILASNNLTSLDEGSLNGLANLQQISLKDNKISSINQNAFYNTPSIAMVDLSGNNITELLPSTFLTQLNLLLIDLSRNKISKTPYGAFNRRVGTVLLHENPLVCTEKVHMLQEGVGVFIPNSEDAVCGPKPKMTTSKPTPAPIVQDEEVPVARTSDNIESRPEGIQSRLGIHNLSPQAVEEEREEVESLQQQVQPIVGSNRPSILNVRPTNIISRPRFSFGSELGGRLPSRENPYSRTAVHVPSGAIPSTAAPAGPAEVGAPEPAPTPSEDLPPRVEIPDVEDKALAKVLSAISVPPSITTATVQPGPRPVTDIADNPNIIHPFPVPFLKRGPNLSSSSRIRPVSSPTSSEASVPNAPIPAQEEPMVTEHTLPPSIVLAPRRPPPPSPEEVERNRVDVPEQTFTEFALRTQPPDEFTTVTKNTNSQLTSSAVIIIVCMSCVGISMVVAFVFLCLYKHRQNRRLGSSSSDSTTARTNAYVAQQAQMSSMIYGTMRSRQGLRDCMENIPREKALRKREHVDSTRRRPTTAVGLLPEQLLYLLQMKTFSRERLNHDIISRKSRSFR